MGTGGHSGLSNYFLLLNIPRVAPATRSYRCLETGLETPHLYCLPYTTFFENIDT